MYLLIITTYYINDYDNLVFVERFFLKKEKRRINLSACYQLRASLTAKIMKSVRTEYEEAYD